MGQALEVIGKFKKNTEVPRKFESAVKDVALEYLAGFNTQKRGKFGKLSISPLGLKKAVEIILDSIRESQLANESDEIPKEMKGIKKLAKQGLEIRDRQKSFALLAFRRFSQNIEGSTETDLTFNLGLSRDLVEKAKQQVGVFDIVPDPIYVRTFLKQLDQREPVISNLAINAALISLFNNPTDRHRNESGIKQLLNTTAKRALVVRAFLSIALAKENKTPFTENDPTYISTSQISILNNLNWEKLLSDIDKISRTIAIGLLGSGDIDQTRVAIEILSEYSDQIRQAIGNTSPLPGAVQHLDAVVRQRAILSRVLPITPLRASEIIITDPNDARRMPNKDNLWVNGTKIKTRHNKFAIVPSVNALIRAREIFERVSVDLDGPNRITIYSIRSALKLIRQHERLKNSLPIRIAKTREALKNIKTSSKDNQKPASSEQALNNLRSSSHRLKLLTLEITKAQEIISDNFKQRRIFAGNRSSYEILERFLKFSQLLIDRKVKQDSARHFRAPEDRGFSLVGFFERMFPDLEISTKITQLEELLKEMDQNPTLALPKIYTINRVGLNDYLTAAKQGRAGKITSETKDNIRMGQLLLLKQDMGTKFWRTWFIHDIKNRISMYKHQLEVVEQKKQTISNLKLINYALSSKREAEMLRAISQLKVPGGLPLRQWLDMCTVDDKTLRGIRSGVFPREASPDVLQALEIVNTYKTIYSSLHIKISTKDKIVGFLNSLAGGFDSSSRGSLQEKLFINLLLRSYHKANPFIPLTVSENATLPQLVKAIRARLRVVKTKMELRTMLINQKEERQLLVTLKKDYEKAKAIESRKELNKKLKLLQLELATLDQTLYQNMKQLGLVLEDD